MSEVNDEIIEKSPDQPRKRGPGRPPKKDKKKRIERLGIVEAPSNAVRNSGDKLNAMELVYENPQMFKKIFALFKVYAVELIHVCFDKDRLSMYAVDHTNHVTINVEILGSMMNRYFIEEPINIDLDTNQFYRIFQVIGKDFTRILFMTNRANIRVTLWMIFLDEQNNKSTYQIQLNDVKEGKITLEQTKELFAAAQKYPVSFELDHKFLKNKIAEMSNLSKKFVIQQDMTNKNSNMCFVATTDDSKIKNTSPIKNPGKSNLVNNYNGQLFTAPVFVNHIRPFVSASLGDNIKIMVDDKKDIVFKVDLDPDDIKTGISKGKVSNSEKGYIMIASKLASSNEHPNSS